MFEQIFKNIDNILYKDTGADGELDYIEQTSWIMFLRYLDELEQQKKDKAELEGKTHQPLLKKEFSWNHWAVSKKDGKLDHKYC